MAHRVIRRSSAQPMSSTSMTFCGYVLSLVALSACEPPTQQAGPTSENQTTAVERWSVSGADSQHPFGEVGGIAVSKAGLLAVPDQIANVIVLFDSLGTVLRTIGREGQGPGEFSRVGRVGFAGEVLWVWDGQNQRRTLIDASSGRFISSEHLAMGSAPAPSVSLAEGRTLGRLASPACLIDFRTEVKPEPCAWVVAGVHDVDTVALVPNDQIYLGKLTSVPFQPLKDYSQVLYSADGTATGFAVLDRLIVKAGAPGYRITVYDSTGGLEREFWRESTARVVTSALIDSLAREGVSLMSEQRVAHLGNPEERIRNAIAKPAWVPPIDQGLFGLLGAIWLKPHSVLSPGSTWTVLDRHGEYVASVTLPGNLTNVVIAGQRIYGVRYDEFERPFVVALDWDAAVRRERP